MPALACEPTVVPAPHQRPDRPPTLLARRATRRMLQTGARSSEIDRRQVGEWTDEALMAAVAQGSQQAFGVLYDRYVRSVVSVANRVVQDHELAKDVAQEVFLNLWRRAASYDLRRGRLAAWLLSVTYHLAIDQVRRRKSRPMIIASISAEYLPEVVDTEVGVEQQAWLMIQRGLLLGAIRQLPLPQRRVIELAYFEELTHVQIAARLGAPLGTVKTRLKLAVARLKRLLATPEGGGQVEGAVLAEPGRATTRR